MSDADARRLLEAGYSEDAIFELTVAAALGAAGERLEAGMRALHDLGDRSDRGDGSDRREER